MSEVTDSTGRKLVVKEMDPADQLDLFEAAGKNSSNSSWVGMALLVCSVSMIDGVPVPMPSTPDQVKTLARKLGKHGIEAVADALQPTTTAEDVIEAAKN